MLGGIGKDAGLSAMQEAHKTVDAALDKVDRETIPAAEAAAKAIVFEAANTVYGIFVDLMNRLNGAEVPIDIKAELRITGKIGAVKITTPDYGIEAQKVEVAG